MLIRLWKIACGSIILSLLLGVLPAAAASDPRTLDSNYKFAGIKAPDSPYKNTWSAFQTDVYSGSFNYNYKIDVPPGTNGHTPDISISYNSHTAKGKAGWVGFGWEIPLSYIQRDIEYTRKDTSDDTFDLILNGAKHDLIFAPTDSRYHTKIETFAKIEFLGGAPNDTGEYWLVTTKDGTQFRFGYNSDSENMVATTDGEMSPYVWRWSLDLIQDANGNSINFSYDENPDNGEIYLSQIEYNNDKKRRLEFILEDRPDSYLVINQGSEVFETKRLKEIKVFAGDGLAGKYVLDYTLNYPENKSLLSTITRYGNDGATSLPPVRFEYQTLEMGFNMIEWSTPGAGQYIRKMEEDGDQYYGTLDITGDGRPDYVKYKKDEEYWAVWPNNGSGFDSQEQAWHGGGGAIKYIRDVREEEGKATNTRSTMMDLNNDGRVDLVWANGDEDRQFKYALNTGSGFSGVYYSQLPTTAWIRNAKKVEFDGGEPENAPNVEQSFLDLNGDSRPDIVKRAKLNSDEYNAWEIWIGKQEGEFAYFGTWPVYHSPNEAWIEDFERDDQDVEATTQDMNGDGLIDIIWGADQNLWHVWINTGSHFRYIGNWAPPGLPDDDIIEMDDHEDSNKAGDVRRDLIDINGDSLPDVVHGQEDYGYIWHVYLNTGQGFTNRIDWPVPVNSRWVRDNTYDNDDPDALKLRTRRDMIDMDGDGVVDIAYRTSDDYWRVYLNQSRKVDLLTRITDTLGGKIVVSYKASIEQNNDRLPFNYWIVDSIQTDNGIAGAHQNTATTHYAYEGGFYDFDTREFRGFSKVIETRADQSKVIHYFHQNEGTKGKEFKAETNSGADAPYLKNETVWNNQQDSAGFYLVLLERNDVSTYDGSPDTPKVVRSEIPNYDEYGNPTQKIYYGDLSNDGDDLYQYLEYQLDIDNWIVDKVSHSLISHSDAGAPIRENWFQFDDKGNLIRQEDFLDSGANPVTTHTYDTYGNRTTSTDAEGRVTTNSFDVVYNTFPIQTCNPLNQCTTKTFNPYNGEVLTDTDPNNFVSSYSYDVFNRLSKEIRPYDDEVLPTLEKQYFIDENAPQSVKTSRREKSGKAGTLDTLALVDGFGKLIQVKTEYEDSANQIIADTFYDAMDRVRQVSVPYLAQSSSDYSQPAGQYFTQYIYDTVGRPTTVINPDNTQITRAFDHWQVTETDEKGRATSYAFDAYQSLVQVVESNQGQCYTTNYTRNPLGELVNIKDHLGNTTQITFDTLGRKVRLQDPDMGIWEYGYSPAGNLIQQTDGRGITTMTEFDQLNRKKKITYPTDPETIFHYDKQLGNSGVIGTLAGVDDASGSALFWYDSRLRKIKEAKTIDFNTYITQWSYNALDKVVSMIYPDEEVVAFTYNNQGLLESIPGVLMNLNYNASGQITQKAFGNGVTASLEYNPANSRLTRILTPELQDFRYEYDEVGNVTAIEDGISDSLEVFEYDGLDRLISAQDDQYTATFEIDPIGNIEKETFVDTEAEINREIEYFYGGENGGPHALTSQTITE